jgi:UDP-N-acetylmuramate--alanine ligase
MTHIHLIGIGGTGLSAIAKVLLERGYQVSGSDLTASPLAAAVAEAGAQVSLGHQADNIRGADLVVRSSAVPEENVEVQAAYQAGIPVLKRTGFLSHLTNGYRTIAVAGSHGKTTTTAMTAWMLTELGQDPSFIAGGVVENLGTNARHGEGELFVIEADEYDHMFLGLDPDLAVVTNVEHDHPDLFSTPGEFELAFDKFLDRLHPEGTLIYCQEDRGARRLAKRIQPGQKAVSYGIESAQGTYRGEDLQLNEFGGFSFQVKALQADRDSSLRISLQVPGKHNVLNALAAFAVGDQLGFGAAQIGRALSAFQGSGRRFEIRGEFRGIVLVDDYGHHPTEIRVSLAAAKAAYPNRRIWALWQPHTYSRTGTFYEDYRRAFKDAEEVIVLDVYAAREEKPPGFDMAGLVEGIHHNSVHFLPEISTAVSYLKQNLQEGDLLLVFTAGDAIEVTNRLQKFFQR